MGYYYCFSFICIRRRPGSRRRNSSVGMNITSRTYRLLSSYTLYVYIKTLGKQQKIRYLLYPPPLRTISSCSTLWFVRSVFFLISLKMDSKSKSRVLQVSCVWDIYVSSIIPIKMVFFWICSDKIRQFKQMGLINFLSLRWPCKNIRQIR